MGVPLTTRMYMMSPLDLQCALTVTDSFSEVPPLRWLFGRSSCQGGSHATVTLALLSSSRPTNLEVVHLEPAVELVVVT